jgi:hypothetical protein
MAVYSDHRIGTLFAARYPDLDLRRDCDTCRSILQQLDASGLSTDPTAAAKQIVRNANRTALRQFGPDRATQQAAIAAILADLVNQQKSAGAAVAGVVR